MKIAVLTTSFPRFKGDIYSPFVYECVRKIARTNEVTLIAPRDLQSVDYHMDNVKLKRFYYFFPRSWQRLAYIPGGIAEQIKTFKGKLQMPFYAVSFFFKALMNTRNVDVIHAHWLPSGVIGYLCSLIYRKPLAVTIRENSVKIATGNFLFRHVLRKADKVIINNEEYKKEALRVGVKEEKIVDIKNGVNELFIPEGREEARKKYNFKETIIIYVGAIVPRKGPDDLFNAVKNLDNVKLVFVGDGELKDKLKGDFVEFMGKRPPEEVKELLNAADIFCLPTKFDGIPNVVVEAMACEKPVVTTNIFGIPEVIDNWENGVMVNPGNVDEITEALKKLIENKDLREKIGKRARESLSQKGITWDKNAEKHIEVYNSLL